MRNMLSRRCAAPSQALPTILSLTSTVQARAPGKAARNVRAKGGVYVPSDSFGGQSPERKAAGILRTFFTFVAARVVLAQLEGSGRGALGAYDSAAATDLHHFLQNVPLKDGDEWLAQLMRQNTSLGLRLMEVRDSYCDESFEWDHLQRIAKQDMKTANTKLMKKFAAASLAASLAQADAEAPANVGGSSAAAAAVPTGPSPIPDIGQAPSVAASTATPSPTADSTASEPPQTRLTPGTAPADKESGADAGRDRATGGTSDGDGQADGSSSSAAPGRTGE